jgi:hypothetical protein
MSKQLGMMPRMVIEAGGKKLGSFDGCRKTTQVAMCPAIYLPFFNKKTPENAKHVKNTNNLAWCLELVIQDHKKSGPFKGCRETRCSQMDPSGQPKHSPLNMIFSWKS